MKFPDSQQVFEAPSEVIWTNRYGTNDRVSPRGMAVKFTNPDPELIRTLERFAELYAEHGNRYKSYYR